MQIWRMLLILMAVAWGGPLLAEPVRISGDAFSHHVTFTGPTLSKNSFFGASRSWHIRSWVNRNTTLASHQLYVDIDYVDVLRRYAWAASDDAQDLEVENLAIDRITRHCSGSCAWFETVGIDLPESLLTDKAATGFQIKLSARSGDAMILDITPAQIRAQLDAIHGWLNPAPLTPPSAAPPAFGADFKNGAALWGLPGGALVFWIRKGSVAHRSGVHWADSIVEWNGQTVRDAADLTEQLSLAKPGTTAPFKVLRGRRIHDLVATFSAPTP